MFGGIDAGTSGMRLGVIDRHGTPQWMAKTSYTLSDLSSWQRALWDLILSIPLPLKQQLSAIAIDGTSGTFLVTDRAGNPLSGPQSYNDDRGREALPQLRQFCPPDHLVLSSTSTLARWVRLGHTYPKGMPLQLMHQADWLGYLLHGHRGITDAHNALKLGYDPIEQTYPPWLLAQPFATGFPQVVAPGTPIGTILPSIATTLGLPAGCIVCAGTTDSNAAFAAAVGPSARPGAAMTSLGSTLVLKILASKPIVDVAAGVYGHRWMLGNKTLWLVGGASNTGGAVLAHYFTPAALERLSQSLDPSRSSGLNYYPLLHPGERFPVCNPDLAPALTPRPPHPELFLHGMLEGIARIESQGYDRLQALGTEALSTLYTVGGGAHNAAWTAIRQQYLRVPFSPPIHQEAAYGTALLAQKGWMNHADSPQP